MKDLVTLIDLVQAWIDRTEVVTAWMPLPEPYKGGEEE